MSKREKRRNRCRSKSGLPKGAYRLPDGGVMMPEHVVRVPAAHGGVDEIVIRGVRRDQLDMKLLARALLETAKKNRDEEQCDQVD